MTTSAKAVDCNGDVLARSLDLYRDLSVTLRRAIMALQTGAADGGDFKGRHVILREHFRCLESVLEFEASLEKRTKAAGDVGLDLDAARAEIRARLARWHADRPD